MAIYCPKGHKVPLANGAYAQIIEKLGEGGQALSIRSALAARNTP